MAEPGKKPKQSEGLLPQADEADDMVAEEISLDQQSGQVRGTGRLPDSKAGIDRAAADALADTLATAGRKKIRPAIDRAVPDSPLNKNE